MGLLSKAACMRTRLLSAAATRQFVMHPPARDMSSKIVATAFGPDREGVLADFTRVVVGVGGTIGGSRAVQVSGTFCVSAVVFLPEEDSSLVADLSWALQSGLPNFVTGIRPAISGNPPTVFGKLEVKASHEYGLIAQVADHIKSRQLSFASLRTHQSTDLHGDPIFTATAVIMHDAQKTVDILTVEKEFYEMGEKLDVTVDFEPYH